MISFANMLRDDSGQALIETAFFAPVVIFGLCLVLYFSQLGVTAERSETAIRYGNDVSYKDGEQAYGPATLYALVDEVENPGNNELGPLCLQPYTPPPSASPIPNSTSAPSQNQTRIQQDIAAAVIQAQVVGSAPPAPTAASAKPFYIPAQIVVPGCQAGMIRLQPADSTGEASASNSNGGLPVSTTGLSVSAFIKSSGPMQSFMNYLHASGSDQQEETSAHMTFLNVATPNTIAACTSVGQLSVNALAPAPLTDAQKAQLAALCPS